MSEECLQAVSVYSSVGAQGLHNLRDDALAPFRRPASPSAALLQHCQTPQHQLVSSYSPCKCNETLKIMLRKAEPSAMQIHYGV